RMERSGMREGLPPDVAALHPGYASSRCKGNRGVLVGRSPSRQNLGSAAAGETSTQPCAFVLRRRATQLPRALRQPGTSEPRRGISDRQPSKRLVISTTGWVALAVAPQAPRDLHYARAVPPK